MAERAGQACRGFWERQGPRWLAGVVIACAVAVTSGVSFSGSASAGCIPTLTNTVLPTFSPSGQGLVGTVLTSGPGNWHDSCVQLWTTSYQWYRGSTAISGATSSTYTTVSADAGLQITARVTADDGCDVETVTANGVFVPTRQPLGTAGQYPVWSHGPVSVNEATGNIVLSLPTPGYPTATGSLGFSLTYNAQQTASGNDGLGVGWQFSAGDGDSPAQVHDHGKDASPSPNAEVDWSDGNAEYYQQSGSGSTFTPVQADGSLLTKNSDNSFTLVNGSGTYTFAVESSSGIAALNGAALAATSNNYGQLTYGFTSGKLTSVSYKETPASSSSETLSFNWSCTGHFLCVTGPDGVVWSYDANASSQITAVNDGTRQLVGLSYNSTSHLLTGIQNADDLDPTHASPGYSSSHQLALTYDSSSPARMTCLIDGPISGQPATSQPSCAGGGTASKSTWSFNYSPTCPTLKTPAVSHSVAQGAKVGCTTLTNPDQQPSGAGITVLYDVLYRTLEYDDTRLSTTSPRISLIQYNAQNQVAWSEDPAGNPTDYSYDPLTGDILSVTGATPSGASARPVTKYRYDEQTIGTASTPGNALTGLAASYWANATLTGPPGSRENDPAAGSGQTGFAFSSWPSSVSGNSLGFSTRWTGELKVPYTGDYTFTTTSQGTVDGTHLVVNGIDEIQNMSSKSTTATGGLVYLAAGSEYPIQLDYAHTTAGTSGATITLSWACGDCSPVLSSQTVPVSDLNPLWGNQTSVVSPAGRITFQHFLDQPSGQADYSLTKVGSSNLITSYVYDSLGRMVTRYMPKANASATLNSTTGNLSSTPDTNYETDYTYYGDGTTVAPRADCGGGTAVDQYGQLQQTTIPNGGLHSVVTVYNAAGLPISHTNGKGTSCLTYNAENRLTSQTPNGDQSHPVSYTYDPSGARLTTSNSAGTVTTYYDEAGRPLDSTDASGAEEHFCYDADSNTTYTAANTTTLGSTTCPLSTSYTTSYSYDAADELTGQTDPAGHSWSFFYDSRGNLRGTQYPNTTFSWVDTDPAGNTIDQYNRHGTITSTTTTPPTDTNPLADYTYTYVDGSSVYQDGKKVSQSAKSGATTQTTNYTYDAAGRLSQALLPSGICRNYSYDLDSNRTQIQEATGCGGTFTTTATYTYNPSTTPGTDQLTSISSGGTTNYAYTSDGQVSSQGTTSYTWDGFGRNGTATVGTNTVTYTYDPTGALMTRATSSPTTTLNYVLGDTFETGGTGTITTSYTSGPAGDLASYNGAPTSSNTATYLYYDAHGNTGAEADGSGSLTANHSYDPFGAPTDTVPSNTTTHRFTGRWDKQYDTSTALVLMGARPYDPATGRFLAVDPIPGGSLNNYDYAGQDPVNGYDLSGQAYVGVNPRVYEAFAQALRRVGYRIIIREGVWTYLIHLDRHGGVHNVEHIQITRWKADKDWSHQKLVRYARAGEDALEYERESGGSLEELIAGVEARAAGETGHVK